MRSTSLVTSLLLTVSTLQASAHQKVAGALKIIHPFTMETSDAGGGDHIVSMTITNSSSTADALIGASSPIAAEAVIVSGDPAAPNMIAVRDKGRTLLSKDGAHIVLKAVHEDLAGYEMFPLTLTFEKTGKVEVEVMVEEK